MPLKLAVSSEVARIGLISAHFDRHGENEGIAIVVPVEKIRDALETDFLVEWREQEDREAAKSLRQ